MQSFQPNFSLIWQYFSEICSIPRPSGKEEKIREYLLDFASKEGFASKVDKAGNVLITRAGSAPAIGLQAHMDMVCEKNNNVEHDFENEGIKTYIKDGWMHADGTTLGADNGIGMAMIMAAMKEYKGDRAIEGIFTVEEETGLSGAERMEKDFFTAETIINLDSEDENELIIGCAGGCTTKAHLKKEEEDIPEVGQFYIEISVKGLLGGHSGGDIHLARANANKLIGDFLRLTNEKYGIQLCEINGGNLHNAIPREASAVFVLPYAHREHVRIDWNIYVADMEDVWLEFEPKMRFDLGSTRPRTKAFTKELTEKIINILSRADHGIVEWENKELNSVKTSTNLASIKTLEEEVLVTTSQRSFSEADLASLGFKTYETFTECGALAEVSDAYPAWQPKYDSKILEITRAAYKELLGKEPIVKCMHAGLECGLLYKKNPTLDIISFGPTLTGVHSPDEKLDLKSTEKIFELLMKVL